MQRRLDKARQPAIGFQVSFGFLVVMLILLVSVLDKERIEEVLATAGAIFVFFITTIFGAIKVELLSESKEMKEKILPK